MSTECIKCGADVSEEFQTEFRKQFQPFAGYNPMSIQYADLPSEHEERERYRRSYECLACRPKEP